MCGGGEGLLDVWITANAMKTIEFSDDGLCLQFYSESGGRWGVKSSSI